MLGKYKVRLVHNIPSVKWIIRADRSGNIIFKRRSPKKGNLYHIFDELIYLVDIVADPNFSLDILITEEEEIRQYDGKGNLSRRGFSIKDRKLVGILKKIRLEKIEDYFTIFPTNVKEPFSTKDVAGELNISINLAQAILYFFKKTELIKCTGKRGKLLLYKKTNPHNDL